MRLGTQSNSPDATRAWQWVQCPAMFTWPSSGAPHEGQLRSCRARLFT